MQYQPKWSIIFEENVPDVWGGNTIGVISNGVGVLFFHAYRTVEEHRFLTCFIYSSIVDLTNAENEITSYPWTAENDSKLMNYLNSDPKDHWGPEGIASIKFFREVEK